MAITYHAGRRIQGLDSDRTATQLPAGSVGGWVELGRTTLGSEGDLITVSSLDDKRYYMILGDMRDGTGDHGSSIRLNSDTGSNYAVRRNVNGGSDSTNTSLSNGGYITDTRNNHNFNVTYLTNLSSKEKLWINQNVHQSTAGAGTAPRREEGVGKWANTSNAVSTFAYYNWHTGNYGTGSEAVVLGWDESDTHTTNFWEELASVELSSASDDISSGTFTAKKYLWIQGYIKQDESTASNMRMQFNGDTGSNYAERQSTNGASDTTGVSADHIPTSDGGKFGNLFNAFIINNSSNEKLAIVHGTSVNTEGAGTAPTRREIVGKWANTSSQITSCRIFRTVGGQYQSGTILKVWGSD